MAHRTCSLVNTEVCLPIVCSSWLTMKRTKRYFHLTSPSDTNSFDMPFRFLSYYLFPKVLTPSYIGNILQVRTLELLKLRFGEAALHDCEIMIQVNFLLLASQTWFIFFWRVKDISDSKRITNYIKSEVKGESEDKDFPLSATIISGSFWPQVKEEQLALPESINAYVFCPNLVALTNK